MDTLSTADLSDVLVVDPGYLVMCFLRSCPKPSATSWNREYADERSCDSLGMGGSRHACTAFAGHPPPVSTLHQGGLSGRKAACRLMVSAAAGPRLARRRESLVPTKWGRPVWQGKLGAYRAFLLEVIDQEPDITLREFGHALAEATTCACPRPRCPARFLMTFSKL